MSRCKLCKCELIKDVNWKRLNLYCIKCYPIYSRFYYESKKEEISIYNKKIYIQNKNSRKRRTQLLKAQKTYYKNNRIKVKARALLEYRVKIGKIKKGSCVICGSSETQAHHKDYSKPLKVIWLCRKHHAKLERDQREKVWFKNNSLNIKYL